MNEEYNTLRAEVLQKIELHNKLIMFAITTTVAILAFAFSQNNAYLFLLPSGTFHCRKKRKIQRNCFLCYNTSIIKSNLLQIGNGQNLCIYCCIY